ncbi:MAG: AbrB family transcriptional regulator [Oscillospiraceae bacterium]|nr:AbrB family transcriptional regulator [Oscillospiraceae bacterium]
MLLRLAVTIAAAMAGGYAALRLKVPAGALIGSMLVVAVINVAFGTAYMPTSWKFYTQVSTGAYLGAKISRADLREMRMILKPAILLAIVMLAFTTAVGILIVRVSDLTPATALFAVAPAGITDMTLASMEFDSEPSIVALIQTVRIVFTICMLPPMIQLIERWSGTHPNPPPAKQMAPDERAPSKKKQSIDEILLTLVIALICGRLGKLAGIPAGAITCSMIGAAAFNLITDHAYMPLRLRQFIQLFAGALIGCTVGREQVLQMLHIWKVVLIAILGYTLLDLAAAWVIHRHTEMDIITALFSSAPGGLTDMALIAEDMGADSIKIAGMHTLRLIGVVILYPSIIGLIVRLLT